MPRTTMSQYPLLAVIGVTALSVAACGSSNKGSSSASPSATGTPSPSASSSVTAPANGNDRVFGQVASVSGTTIQVTQPSGPATVAFSPSTKILELTPAKLTDITPGRCVTVRPSSGAEGGSVTAEAVVIGTATDGQCHKTGGADNAGLPPTPLGGFRGTVDSVSGNTIVVTTTGSTGGTAQTTVQVSDTTMYADRHPTNSQAITQGKCIAARGTTDSAGTLQAMRINLPPLAGNGTCPQPR